MTQEIDSKRGKLILVLGITSVVYGLFLIAFVCWKLFTKNTEWVQSDLIFLIPQFAYGCLFFVGGIGVYQLNNKCRILLLLTAMSKILFILVFMGTFTSISAHFTQMAGAYPLALAHDIISTALALVIVISFTSRNSFEAFAKKSIDVKDDIRCKIKWYGAFSAILLIISIASVVPDKLTLIGIVNSMWIWAFLFIFWRFVMNVLDSRAAK